MKNIHVLPTEKTSRLQLQMNGNLHIENGQSIALRSYQNIYITSDEKIKTGEWCFEMYNGESKATSPNFMDENGNRWWLRQINMNCSTNDPECKKIILTTDQDLIKDGVQAIDDEFLEWFVKNQSCEGVEVEKQKEILGEVNGTTYIDFKYKIIIPKEEPKFESSIGNTINIMGMANTIFGKQVEPIKEHNKFLSCCRSLEECYCGKNEETLEEVANKLWKQSHPNPIEMALFGAKWQQERSYSEEEVLVLLIEKEQNTKDSIEYDGVEYLTPEEWFELFKKK